MDYFDRGRNYQFDAVGEWQGKLVWQFGELRQLVTLVPPTQPTQPSPPTSHRSSSLDVPIKLLWSAE